MPKYDPLLDYLQSLDRSREHRLSFAEIERIIGFKLPSSARTYQAWWANQKNGRHVQAHAWLDAGWHTKELDLKSGWVTFWPVRLARAPKGPELTNKSGRGLSIEEAKRAVAHRFGVRPDDVEITVRG